MVLEIENLDYKKQNKKKKVFFFFDSMNNFNVKFPLLLKMVLGIENLDYIKKKKCFFNYQTKDLFINEGVLLQILSIGHSREVPNCKISHTYFT